MLIFYIIFKKYLELLTYMYYTELDFQEFCLILNFIAVDIFPNLNECEPFKKVLYIFTHLINC